MQALSVAEDSYSWWRDGVKDLWNVAAIATGVGDGQDPACAGQPWANSHCGPTADRTPDLHSPPCPLLPL